MVMILENTLKLEFPLGHGNCDGKQRETTTQKYFSIETKL